MFGRSHAGSVPGDRVGSRGSSRVTCAKCASCPTRNVVRDRQVDLAVPLVHGDARPLRPAAPPRGPARRPAPRPGLRRRWRRRRPPCGSCRPSTAAPRHSRDEPLVDGEVRVAGAGRRFPVPRHVERGVDAASPCRRPACCRSNRGCPSWFVRFQPGGEVRSRR